MRSVFLEISVVQFIDLIFSFLAGNKKYFKFENSLMEILRVELGNNPTMHLEHGTKIVAIKIEAIELFRSKTTTIVTVKVVATVFADDNSFLDTLPAPS